MITLDYRLNSADLRDVEGIDLRLINETDIHYGIFTGDIIFRIDSANFDALWGWIPVLGFAIELSEIVHSIADLAERRFEFTESEAAIVFRRSDGLVRVSTTYASGSSLVALEDLQQAVTMFARRVLNEIGLQWPSLQQSPLFNRMKDKVNSY